MLTQDQIRNITKLEQSIEDCRACLALNKKCYQSCKDSIIRTRNRDRVNQKEQSHGNE